MRIVLNSRPGVVFGAVFAMALIVLLPLRIVAGALALDDAGVSARAVHGSIWAGGMDEAAVGGMPLGDVDARLSPLPLVTGEGRLTVAAKDDPDGLRGAVTVSRNATGVDGVSARLPAASAFAPLPISELDLSNVEGRFADGRCAGAAGQVRAVIAGDLAGIDLGGALTGTIRCDGPALLVPLASAAGTERIMLRITSDGRYDATLTAQPRDPDAMARLAQAGFRPTAAGYALAVRGTLP